VVACRLLNGAGEACFFVSAATLISDLAPPERRGEAVSYFSIPLYLGLAIGPLVGETLLNSHGFTPVWLVAGGVAAIGSVTSLAIPARHLLPPGWADVALAQGDLAMSPGRPSREQPKSKLLHKAALLPGAVLTFQIMGYAGFIAFVPLYAPTIGLAGSRLVFVLYAAVVLCVRVAFARLPDRLGAVPAASGALALSAAGLLTMGLWHRPAGLLAGTVILALGSSLAFPALMSLAIGAAPDEERGSVVGTFSAFFDVSQGLGAAVLGGVAAATSYSGAFVAGGVIAAVGLVLLRIRGPGYSRTSDTDSPSPTPTMVDSSRGSDATRELNSRIPSTSPPVTD
jgi:MFS family permease